MLLPVILVSCALLQEGAGTVMPTTKATVHDVTDRIRDNALAVVATPNAETNKDALVKLLMNAAEGGILDFKAGTTLTVLALGPTVDGPDRAAVRSLVRTGARLELEIAHTNVRGEGIRLRRNILKQHLAEVPSETLPPGQYTLTVTWRPVKAVLEGRQYRDPKLEDKPLADQKPLVQTIKFRILEK